MRFASGNKSFGACGRTLRSVLTAAALAALLLAPGLAPPARAQAAAPAAAAVEAPAEGAKTPDESAAFEPAAEGAAPAAAPATAEAAAPAPIDRGDTAWMLISTALVLLMTPGLAFFYGGLVRSKNVLGTMMQSLSAMALVGVLWAVVGYSIAFGPDVAGKGLVGGLKFLMLKNVGQLGDGPVANIPHLIFMAFQGMFAIITPALIGGAVAERMKFKAYLTFIAAWVLIVYCPLAHWVWGAEGWLVKRGALDFAGGTVVHISSGASALVACIVLGRRQGFPREPILPHNVPFVILGGGLLWFGWFGFNAGSALAADGIAVNALVTTHIAASAGAFVWMMNDWIRFGKPTALGTVSGGVAGLVGITPGAGFVEPGSAIAIGAITALCCATFVHWRTRRGLDDSLDAFGVHGVGGTIGALLTGVFATKLVNPLVAKPGLIDGGTELLVNQSIAIVATYAYAGILSFILLKVINVAMGLRVGENEERMGLDQSQHGENAYSV